MKRHSNILSFFCAPPNKNEDQRILYGEENLVKIQKALAADISDTLLLKEFRQYKFNGVQGVNLRKLFSVVSTLPVSTAECERGFSAMNRILTEERNRMTVSTLNSLLFLGVNGPEVRSFPAEKFAEMWIKEGHNAANSAPTGKEKRPHEVLHQSKLFM